jgi:hypothetical protein
MPREQRLGRDDRSQLDQHLPFEPFRLDRQPAALIVRKAQSFVAQLLSKNPILFLKVVD